MQINFTEEEAIQITIDHGYDGSEFETTVWKDRGCLKDNGTMKALISKLETIYHQVEVTGKGKKREYILSDKKEQKTERVFKYKGSVPAVEDEIMKEYIFKKLLDHRGAQYSYKGWADQIEMPNVNSFSTEKMIHKLKDLHSGFPVIYNPKEAVSEFIKTFDTRNKNVIQNSFKWLQSEGRIHVDDIYCIKHIDEGVELISQDDYEEVQRLFKEFLDSKEITYYSYTQSLTSIFKTKRNKEIIAEAEEFLEDFLGIEFFFKSFKVTILDSKIHNEISTQQFESAYYERLVNLTQNRQEKDKYKNSPLFWKRFYLLNTLTLLDYIEVNQFNELLAMERKSRYKVTDDFATDCTLEIEIEQQAFGKKYIHK